MPEVRKATSSEVAPLSEALARAFDDDPIVRWAFSHAGRRARGARRFFARMLRWALPQGEVLLAPMLHTCDRDLIPAYLETGKKRNVDFYSRHGFRVTEELQLPRGPRVWLMWRDPAS
ncbi:MAG TPA: hypothetical protein VIM22_06945 [Solirubrobacteraceae bacterium]